MFEITCEISWQIRKKRAYLNLSISDTAGQIGISRQTLSKIESGSKSRVKKDVYKKIVNWLIKENNIESRGEITCLY